MKTRDDASKVSARSFLSDPHSWCPRCGACEAFHPEACDISPEEWRAVEAGVAAARRTRETWRLVAVVHGFGVAR